MITFNDFTDEMRDEIITTVKTAFVKLGINAEVNLEITPKKNGYSLYVKTDSFNTMPVIYKDIYVDGYGCLEEIKGHEGIYELRISFSYRFRTFSGGSNGTDLGEVAFRVFEDSMEVRKKYFNII
jgi:hypothetical protein